METKKINLTKQHKTIITIACIVIVLLILYFTGFITRFYETYFKSDSTNISSNTSSNSSNNINTSDNNPFPLDDNSEDGTSDSIQSNNVDYSDNLTCSTISITTNSSIGGSETYTTCSISISDCAKEYELNNSSAGIRLRGNSTMRYSKKPYRIKFDESTQLLGLSTGPSKSWVLLAEYNDYSMLRNALTYNFANRLDGLDFAPDCAFVNLYINDSYKGVYLLTEQIQVSNDRIDIDESGVDNSSITDTGYLLEMEADSQRRNEEGRQGTDWFAVTGYAGSSSSNNNFFNNFNSGHSDSYDVAFYVIKSDAKSSEQVEYIQNYMISVYDAIYKDKNFEKIDELIDIDSAVDMYILQLLCNDYDNNFSSSYVYKDAGGKLCFGPPWDFDLAYGNYNGHSSYNGETYMFHLLKELGTYDWFMELVSNRFSELNNGSDSPIQHMLASINTYTTELTDEFENNYSETYSSNRSNSRGFGGFNGGGFNGGISTSYSSQSQAASALYDWLNNRINYLLEDIFML